VTCTVQIYVGAAKHVAFFVIFLIFCASKILSYVCVTTDGDWIGNWIYWARRDRNCSNYSAITNSHSAIYYSTLLGLLSLLCVYRLPGNGFNNVKCFHAYVLIDWRLSHNCRLSTELDSSPLHCTNWTEPGRSSDTASERTNIEENRFQQFFYCCVTQLSHGTRREYCFPVSPLVRVRYMLPSNGRCLQSRYLTTGLHATLF
jgi:hypothetical protein